MTAMYAFAVCLISQQGSGTNGCAVHTAVCLHQGKNVDFKVSQLVLFYMFTKLTYT
jgi:hypothetical protein